MALDIIKKKDEELIDYMIRLYENRQAYGLSNQDVADLLNKEDDEDYDESRRRKIYQSWENHFSEYVTKSFDDAEGYNSDIIDNLELARLEIKNEKVRFRDEKREENKMNHNDGRWEHVEDTLIENVQALDP